MGEEQKPDSEQNEENVHSIITSPGGGSGKVALDVPGGHADGAAALVVKVLMHFVHPDWNLHQ
jgi:hypothetical protein